MRVAYLGTSEFAAAVLRGLAERAAAEQPPGALELALVVTPPDRPQGRRRRLGSPPAAVAAKELGLELHQTADVNSDESRARVGAAGAEMALVCAFGQILREPLLSEAELWNIHPSLLPRWRGAAPIERAIMAGDAETGVTIARVTAGLDSGPVALESRVAIEPGDDRGSLGERLAALAVELAARAVVARSRGPLEASEQGEEGATYAEKIDPAERRLDPARRAIELERIVRALTPYVGAYLELSDGEWLGVVRARIGEGDVAAGSLEAADGALLLGCAAGVLRIDRVKPAGGREMDAAEYLRGHPLPVLAQTGAAGGEAPSA